MAAYTGFRVMKDAIVKFGSTNFENQCTGAQLEPDVPSQQVRTLVPDGQVTDTDSAAWKFNVKALQDHESGGLASYLVANSGLTDTLVFAPRRGSGLKQWTATVRIQAVPIGDDQGKFPEFEVSLDVQGQPVASVQP